jgi:hypothetical protein
MDPTAPTTVVLDGPHPTPNGGQMTRILMLDAHGCEIGWAGIDAAGHGYGPTAEHPDRELLGFPEGVFDQPWSFYNNVDEGWACPSYEGAVEAALLEHAVRLDEGWYAGNSDCAEADPSVATVSSGDRSSTLAESLAGLEFGARIEVAERAGLVIACCDGCGCYLTAPYCHPTDEATSGWESCPCPRRGGDDD